MKAVGVIGVAAFLQIAVGLGAGELVDLSRAESDSAYRERVYYHTAIKSYLASPLRGKPELEEVLTFLLQNGFSIRDLHNAYVVLHMPSFHPAKRPEFRREMFERGFDEDQIQVRVAQVSVESSRRNRQRVQQMTGLEDNRLLDAFMRLAPESPAPLGPSSTFMPSMEAEDGEPLLTDSDWMSDEHRKAAAANRGERRRLAPSPPAQAPAAAAERYERYRTNSRVIPRMVPRRSTSTNTIGAAAPGGAEAPHARMAVSFNHRVQ